MIKESLKDLILFLKKANEIYVIKDGDTISSISGGDQQYIVKILKENPGIDPLKLRVGQKIILPAKIQYQNYSLSSKGRDFIKQKEGFSQFIYKDIFNNLTIGWGHKLTEKDFSLFHGLTKQKAMSLSAENLKHYKLNDATLLQLFNQDVEKAEAFVNRNITAKLTQNQFDAIVSIVFNVGVGSFYNSNLYDAIEKKKDLNLALRIIPTYKAESQGLLNRRKAEADYFSSR